MEWVRTRAVFVAPLTTGMFYFGIWERIFYGKRGGRRRKRGVVGFIGK